MRMVDARWDTKTTVLSRPSSFKERRITASFKLSRLLSGFIQQHQRCIVEESSCQTQPLPFAAGEGISQLAHGGIIALGKCLDEVMDRGFLTGCHDFFVGGVQLGNPKIISDAVVEQMGFWVTKLSKSRRFPVLISFTARPDKVIFPFWTSQSA